MNEAIDEPAESIFTPVLHSGPLELLLTLFLAAIGTYHIVLSTRTLAGRGGSTSAGVHALLLLSTPSILFLLVCATLPPTVPGIFIVGIDADQPFKHSLALTSFLGWMCLGSFITNLFLSLIVLKRSQRSV